MRIIQITENNAYYWHRRLWLWLANNPKANKEDWPGWRYIEQPPYRCFACQIAKKRIIGPHGDYASFIRRCEKCPITDWVGETEGMCEKYEFGEWRQKLNSPKKKSKFARIIADKLWKQE